MRFQENCGASVTTANPATQSFAALSTYTNSTNSEPNPQPPKADRSNLDLALELLAAKRCPLAVAPAFPADQYPARDKNGKVKTDKEGNPLPAFTGKNPSWVDQSGKPRHINHHRYQNTPPTEAHLRMWFANPINGIGQLGGHGGLHCIDIDRKDFPSQEACDAAFVALIDRPGMAAAPVDRTPGGGYHVEILLESPPGHTNFCFTPGGHHAGELLGHGRFFVIAPTLGPDGKFYETIQTGTPPLVTDLASIGVYQYQKSKPAEAEKSPHPRSVVKPKPRESAPTAAPIDLEKLVTDKTRSAIAGDDWKGDRSETLTTAIHDLFGWANWCQSENIAVSGDPESLVFEAGRALGLDNDRIARILKTVDVTTSKPSCVAAGGDESAWKRVRKLEPAYKPAKPSATAKKSKQQKPVPFEDASHQKGFDSDLENGLTFTSYDLIDGEVVPTTTQVGGHLKAEAHTNSPEGDNAGLRLVFQDQRGRIQHWTMPRGLISDTNLVIAELAKRGYFFSYDHKKLLVKFLVEVGQGLETAFTIILRTGWVEVDGSKSFVLHGETIGDKSIRYLDVDPPPNPLLQRCGDIQNWQQTIGAMAIGNSRLIGAIGVALAAPLLDLLEVEGGGIHYFGASSTGKTTALAVAISVTGEARPATWNSTANGLEAGAEAHSSLLFPIDEIGQAHPKTVDEASYNLANGAGRTRMTKDLSARKIKIWRTLFLSTGEFAMLPFLKTAGITAKGGQEARMPSVPADAGAGLGAYDTIHGFSSPQQFADELKLQAPKNKGTALVAFLDRLVPLANNPDWVDRQRARHQAITDKLKGTTIDSDGTVGRVARRFALIQLALELAQEWGVTLFPEGQVEWAVQRLFSDWIDARGGAGSIDIRQACDRIEALFVAQEFGDRIRHVTGDRQQQDRLVRNLLATKLGEDFLVPPSVFDSEFAQGVDRKLLIAELKKRGWLDEGDKGHNTQKRRLPGEPISRRVFVFSRFWAGDEADEAGTPEAGTPPAPNQNPYWVRVSELPSPVPAPQTEYRQAGTPETFAQQGLEPTCPRVPAVPAKKDQLGKENEQNKNFASDSGHVEIDPNDFDWSVAGSGV